jgi:putative transposase
VRQYRLGAHTKFDLKVHIVWIPKYRKKAITGPVAIRARDLIRQIAMEHDLQIRLGQGRQRPRSRLRLVPTATRGQQEIVQWLKGISSRVLLQEFSHLRRQFWGKYLWARG